jgi:hypothetical protein
MTVAHLDLTVNVFFTFDRQWFSQFNFLMTVTNLRSGSPITVLFCPNGARHSHSRTVARAAPFRLWHERTVSPGGQKKVRFSFMRMGESSRVVLTCPLCEQCDIRSNQGLIRTWQSRLAYSRIINTFIHFQLPVFLSCNLIFRDFQ